MASKARIQAFAAASRDVVTGLGGLAPHDSGSSGAGSIYLERLLAAESVDIALTIVAWQTCPDVEIYDNSTNSESRGAAAMSIRLTICSQIEQVAAEHNKKLVPLNDNIPLLNLGLDSLCFAVLVARLEDTLGVDPFTAEDDIVFPVTLGEFVKFYENAA